ncbi:MAG: hypothetical protein M5U28_00700 [Sandaracinaceae bacterium]|nr:hypothetical protein [Sandaracinaceae bacterium]
MLARGVPDEMAAAAQQAVVDRVSAMAGGRPVHALGAAEIRDAIAACGDDACIGAQLGQAGAQAGVIVRLRGRRPVHATLEIRDPVSGARGASPSRGRCPPWPPTSRPPWQRSPRSSRARCRTRRRLRPPCSSR